MSSEKSLNPGEHRASFDEEGSAEPMARQVIDNPAMLAALQEQLEQQIPAHLLIKALPKAVQRRLKAMKKLQYDRLQIESKYYDELHAIDCKYAKLYDPIENKIADIISGTSEPTDEECDWPSDEDEDEEGDTSLPDEMKTKANIVDETKKEGSEEKDVKGIPHFWLTVLKSVSLIAEMIQPYDEPILELLQNVRVVHHEEPKGFTLEFHFSQNEYFSNTVLTKWYGMFSDIDPKDKWGFEGLYIDACKGCTINWKKGKDVTVKVIKKKQKHKNRGTTRTVTKTVQADSFFNFFSPPQGGKDELDEEAQNLLQADYEIGHFIRERIVPRAALIYTGDYSVDDDDDEDLDEEEEGEELNDSDESDDFDEEDERPARGGNAKQDGAEKPSECKQQ